MITTFLFFLSGFIAEIRILEKIFSEKLISRDFLTKIGTSLVIFNFILIFFLPREPIFTCLVFSLNVFALFLAEKSVRRWRLDRFKLHFLSFLTSIILQMRIGRNFSQAFLLGLDQQPRFYKERLQELYQILFFSESKQANFTANPFMKEIFSELTQIKSRPQNALRSVQNLRDRLAAEEKYRMKSRILKQQCHIQTIVLSILYFGLLIYSGFNFDLSKSLSLIALSLTLYLTGISIILFIGRNHKWSV